jgi:hypothetical protein
MTSRDPDEGREAAVRRFNCEHPRNRELALHPARDGPLVLRVVSWQPHHPSPLGRRGPLISPDAEAFAFCQDRTLIVTGLEERDAWRTWPICGQGSAWYLADGPNSFAWSADSTFLWTFVQDQAAPNIHAEGPVDRYVARAMAGGRLDRLPSVTHPAGPLEGIIWVGGEGLFVGQFGERFGVSAPDGLTFAIVDAREGRVRDAFSLGAFPECRFPNGALAWPGEPDAVVLPDGRVRLFVRIVRSWLAWTEGETPRVTADPYPFHGERHQRVALSPDGTRVLIRRALRTDGWIHVRGRGTISGRPVEGVLAALHDVATGERIWEIRGRVTREYTFPPPAVSPDGRYALVGLLPGDALPDQSLIGLIAMADGAVVQTFPAPSERYSMGFARDGRAVWTHDYGLTAVYDLRDT